MPYLGLKNGDKVIPPQVSDGATVRCGVCDDEMYVKRSHYRGDSFVSRHFVHKSGALRGGGGENGDGGSSDCPGESETHHKMKAIAYARLEEDFPDTDLKLEGHVEGRFADVLLTFPEPRAPYGKGIAVEAQYRNKGKDVEAVTEHYFEHSYSVAWLDEDDFTTHDVDLSGILTLWPNALPDQHDREGYPESVQWLWENKQSPVMMEIPIPGEYWASFDRAGEWTTIAEREVKFRGSIRIVKSPTGDITFGASKATRSGGESMQVQVQAGDADELRAFADDLDSVAFGDDRPVPEECDPKWHDLTTAWLTGTPNVTVWLSATLPSPTSDVVLQLGKKNKLSGSFDRVSMKMEPYAAESFREIADLLEMAFAVECGDRSVLIPTEGAENTDDILTSPIVATAEKLELLEYCLRCGGQTRLKKYGECVYCDGLTVVRSIFESTPKYWEPMMAPPGTVGYRHQYLDVEVTIPIPKETYMHGESSSSVSGVDADPRPDTYSAVVKWPNHIPHQKEWVAPLTPIIDPADAKEWLRNLLNRVDERYVPGELTSLGQAFGDEIAVATKDTPTVSDEFDCDVCGAYLPHYRGSSLADWYEAHYKYLSDQQATGHEERASVGWSSSRMCPHCDADLSYREAIAHIQKHGYSKTEAYRVRDRMNG